jgi:hypothetical protein
MGCGGSEIGVIQVGCNEGNITESRRSQRRDASRRAAAGMGRLWLPVSEQEPMRLGAPTGD